MPVSLDEMMQALPSADRAEIERTASALASEYRLRACASEAQPADRPAPVRAIVGTRAMTGQRCPESGIWRVESAASATMPVAVHNPMPPYENRAVIWVLVEHA